MQLNGAITPARGDFLTKYASIFVLLPLLSNVFPYLITMAESATGQDERRNLIILFLILKRVYLYCMAISIVDLSALRSIDLPSSLGSRLKMLNDEILQSFGATNISKSFNEGEVAQQAYAELDHVSGVSVAVFLPAFLVLSLFSSFFLFGSSLSTAETSSSILPNEVLQTLRSSLNLFPALGNFAVCTLFFQVEVRNFFSWLANGKEDNENGQEISTSNQIPLLLSTAGVLFAFLTPSSLAWPIRNVINTCIAVTAARSVQLASLPVTVAALGGLVAYDLFGVYGSSFLVPPAAAVGPASSVMESVAKAKLSGSSWQPGLLEVVIDGKPTDALGLADAVFPAMLSGWAARFDRKQTNQALDESKELAQAPSNWYLTASLGGYSVGCFLCEVFNSGAGQPALLFLVPTTFLSIVIAAGVRSELGNIWKS